MKKNLISFLLICMILCTLFTGCGEDTNPSGTTGSDVTQNTTELTDPILTTETDATIPGGQVITYTEYQEMNGEQQKDVISRFESKEEFANWYEEIKEDHELYVESTKPQPQETTSTEETLEEKPYFPDATDISAPEKNEVTYQDYHNMSAKEQKAFLNTFASYDDFFEWHDAAKKAYQDSMIEIDGTEPIDVEDILENLAGDTEATDGK